MRSWFGMVDYSDVKRAYEQWLRSAQEWDLDRRRLAESLSSLTRINERLTLENGRLSESLRECALRSALKDVGPIEGIDKALDILMAVRDAMLADGKMDTSELDRAMMELEHALKVGGNHAHR